MGYEYERSNKNTVSLMWKYDAREARVKELKKVYAKAKAFDEVIKKVETEYVSEDLADDIRILVNDYEYDKEEK